MALWLVIKETILLKRLSALVNEHVDCGYGSGGSNPTPNSQEGKARGVGRCTRYMSRDLLDQPTGKVWSARSIYDHLCKRFFSKHFRADAPSTIIKHGLLENSPFSSVIFPARNLHSVRGTSQLAAKPLNLGFVFPNVFRSKPECVPRTRGEFEAETPYLWN